MLGQKIAGGNSIPATGVAIEHRGKRVLLKWHRLRRKRSDPLFSAEILSEGLRLGASTEIDLRATSDGSFAVLHDHVLDRETDGSGLVFAHGSEEVQALHYAEPAQDGSPRRVLILDDLAKLVGPAHPDAQLQLDMKDDLQSIGERGLDRLGELFSGLDRHLVVSGDDTALTLAIAKNLPRAKRGLEPSARLFELYKARRERELIPLLVGELEGPIQPHIVYLNWKLVLAADAQGVDLIRTCHDHGALVDAWTFNLAHPASGFSDNEWHDFARLLDLGADQITTDEAIATERAYRARATGLSE